MKATQQTGSLIVAAFVVDQRETFLAAEHRYLRLTQEKGARGELFRIYDGPGDYRTAKMIDGFTLGDLISPVSNSGARFSEEKTSAKRYSA